MMLNSAQAQLPGSLHMHTDAAHSGHWPMRPASCIQGCDVQSPRSAGCTHLTASAVQQQCSFDTTQALATIPAPHPTTALCPAACAGRRSLSKQTWHQLPRYTRAPHSIDKERPSQAQHSRSTASSKPTPTYTWLFSSCMQAPHTLDCDIVTGEVTQGEGVHAYPAAHTAAL
jgi:hypothetical protein